MRADHTTCRARGFTLVELLIVITIIGLLVSIALPALSKSREQAVIISCASVERQNMIALIGYTADNKGGIPPVNNTTTTVINLDSFYPWYAYPIPTTLGANTQRYAAAGNSPYGNRMGMGHVIGGGYLGSPKDNKSGFEPTYSYPYSAPYAGFELGTHAGMAAYYNFVWNRSGVTTTSTSAPNVDWGQNGYLYRGWLGDPSWAYGTWMLDRFRKPRIDSMFDRAAIWCLLVNHQSGYPANQAVLCHRQGFNVGYFDGHSKFVADLDGKIALNSSLYPYAEMDNFLIRDRFDPSTD